MRLEYCHQPAAGKSLAGRCERCHQLRRVMGVVVHDLDPAELPQALEPPPDSTEPAERSESRLELAGREMQRGRESTDRVPEIVQAGDRQPEPDNADPRQGDVRRGLAG